MNEKRENDPAPSAFSAARYDTPMGIFQCYLNVLTTMDFLPGRTSRRCTWRGTRRRVIKPLFPGTFTKICAAHGLKYAKLESRFVAAQRAVA